MKTILLNNCNYNIRQTSTSYASPSLSLFNHDCNGYEQQNKGSSKYIKALYNKTCIIDFEINTSRFLNE